MRHPQAAAAAHLMRCTPLHHVMHTLCSSFWNNALLPPPVSVHLAAHLLQFGALKQEACHRDA